MGNRIGVEITDHVARVTLNRADKYNAVDAAMFDAFIDVGAMLSADRSLRAVVLHGAGDHFCAGIDVSTFGSGETDAAAMSPRDNSPANYYQSAAYVWRRMPVPVIAALHGVVFGAGLQIALGADVRIAAPTARLSIMEVKWGLVPDMALSTTIVPLANYDRVAELVWTGRVLEAADAERVGIVSRLADDPLAEALQLARQIAAQSPDAIRASKQLLLEAYGCRDESLLALEASLQSLVMAGANHREAVSANIEKRPPSFSDSSA